MTDDEKMTAILKAIRDNAPLPFELEKKEWYALHKRLSDLELIADAPVGRKRVITEKGRYELDQRLKPKPKLLSKEKTWDWALRLFLALLALAGIIFTILKYINGK